MSKTEKTEIEIPLVGCVVVGVFSVLDIIISIITLYSNPTYDEALLHKYIPVLKEIVSLRASLALIFSTILLIGVILAYLKHPNGKKTVRVASYAWMLVSIFLLMLSYFNTTSWSAWETTEENFKTAFSAAFFTAILFIGIWTLFIVYLFKESKKFFTKKVYSLFGASLLVFSILSSVLIASEPLSTLSLYSKYVKETEALASKDIPSKPSTLTEAEKQLSLMKYGYDPLEYDLVTPTEFIQSRKLVRAKKANNVFLTLSVLSFLLIGVGFFKNRSNDN